MKSDYDAINRHASRSLGRTVVQQRLSADDGIRHDTVSLDQDLNDSTCESSDRQLDSTVPLSDK